MWGHDETISRGVHSLGNDPHSAVAVTLGFAAGLFDVTPIPLPQKEQILPISCCGRPGSRRRSFRSGQSRFDVQRQPVVRGHPTPFRGTGDLSNTARPLPRPSRRALYQLGRAYAAWSSARGDSDPGRWAQKATEKGLYHGDDWSNELGCAPLATGPGQSSATKKGRILQGAGEQAVCSERCRAGGQWRRGITNLARSGGTSSETRAAGAREGTVLAKAARKPMPAKKKKRQLSARGLIDGRRNSGGAENDIRARRRKTLFEGRRLRRQKSAG